MDIVVSNLSKNYGAICVLDCFSASFCEHGITCVMGPSGCGKTTLLHILMGLLTPDSGTVRGVPVRKSAVFQEDRLCESFGAVANIHLVCDRSVENKRMIEHLEEIGLKDSLGQPASELSGGQKRRVALARAVLATSDVLFLDEPFKGLDDQTKATVIQYLKRHTQGKTLIAVTHDMDEVHVLGGELIVMPPKTGEIGG
jgi:NitT/TauT family transport system ATP-binding protein